MTLDEVKKLKVGDKVRCISTKYSSPFFEIGKEYNVVAKDPAIIESDSGIWYLDYYGARFPYYEDFEVVQVFDINSPYGYETRNGCLAEVFVEKEGYFWDRTQTYHGWVPSKWYISGKICDSFTSEYDLVNKPKPEPKEVEIYLEVNISTTGYATLVLPINNHKALRDLPIGDYKVSLIISEKDKI